MESKIFLEDIFPLENLAKSGKILLVRHFHKDLKEMNERNLIEEYQSFQNKKAFRNCKYIVSFLSDEKNSAIFFGLFEVVGIFKNEKLPEYSLSLNQYCLPQNSQTDFFLILERVNRFDIYRDRLVVDWSVPRGWYNTYGKVQSKEIIKLLPYNFVRNFPGLMNIVLSFKELQKIIENPASHLDWYESLTRLQAVYLILDKENGNKYIGTTYGENGLWQRWETYIKGDKTGNNKEFLALKATTSSFYSKFQFSILEVLSKTANQSYCIEKESLWKEKLGSKAFGLNKN